MIGWLSALVRDAFPGANRRRIAARLRALEAATASSLLQFPQPHGHAHALVNVAVNKTGKPHSESLSEIPARLFTGFVYAPRSTPVRGGRAGMLSQRGVG